MSRNEIKELGGNLDARLEDDFEKKVLIGGLRVLDDTENPIRLNLFAAAIRELFTHVLHKLSPDDEVKKCSWYVRNDENDRPTRRQRAIYATQGGLTDAQVNELGVNATDVHQDCVSVFEELNRQVHVRPNTLVTEETEITAFATRVLHAFCKLFDVVNECRGQVETAVLNAVTAEAFRALTERTISELDELSNHTYVEGPVINDVCVTSIDAEHIHYRVTGEVDVTLNYGSSSEFQRGDGVSMDDNYPFELTMCAPVAQIDRFEHGRCVVDNSSFYE